MKNPDQTRKEISFLSKKLAEAVMLDAVTTAETKGLPSRLADQQRDIIKNGNQSFEPSDLNDRIGFNMILQERLNNRASYLISFTISILVTLLASTTFTSSVITMSAVNMTTMTTNLIIGVALIFSYITTYQVFTTQVETIKMKSVSLTISILMSLIFLSMIIVQITILTGGIIGFLTTTLS